MAAPLSFPDGCRHKCGSMLGQRNGNPRLRAYVRLQTGIFCMCVSVVWLSVVFGIYLHDAASVAVLEFFAAATWTWIIASGHFVFHDGGLWLSGASVLSGSLSLSPCSLIVEGIAMAFGISVAAGALLGSCLLHLAWILCGNLAAHEGGHGGVVNLVDHGVE